MKKRIILSVGPSGWLANYHGNQEIWDLFQTYTIPTSYTPHATAEIVLAGIRRLNPGYDVVLA